MKGKGYITTLDGKKKIKTSVTILIQEIGDARVDLTGTVKDWVVVKKKPRTPKPAA